VKTYELTDEIQVIGSAGETDIAVAVDVAAWQQEYSDGIGAMLCERPDGRPVPLEAEISGTDMIAELPDECLSRPGVYTYTATWTQAGTLVLSQRYKAIIQSTTNGRGHPPDCPGTPAWATQIFVKAEQIDAALDAAMQTAQDAEDAREAKGAAEDAQEAAEAARDRAETAADTITTSTVEETLEYLGITT
jgi:hypothetical protein